MLDYKELLEYMKKAEMAIESKNAKSISNNQLEELIYGLKLICGEITEEDYEGMTFTVETGL